MLNVLIRIASSRLWTFQENFVGLKNFELAMINEPSVFELVRFDCTIKQNFRHPKSYFLFGFLSKPFNKRMTVRSLSEITVSQKFDN